MLSRFPSLRDAFRSLRRHPGSSLFAVAALAAGIGGNAVVFSALRAVLLTPPPVVDPDRLLELTEVERKHPDRPFGVSWPAYRDWSRGLADAARLAAMVSAEYTVAGLGEPARLQVALVSASFFEVTGVAPALGRGFEVEEDQRGRAPVAVANDAFWRSHFEASPAAIGRRFRLGGHEATLIGVMPAGFDLPSDVSLYLPLGVLGAPNWEHERRAHVLDVLARLAPGVTREAVAGRVAAIARAGEVDDPGHATRVLGLQEALAGNLELPLSLLQVAAAGLLAIACVNLAGLLLARAQSRSREWAVRRALGAGAGHIVRLALGESLLLAGLGALAGLVAAAACLPLLAHLVPDSRMANLAVDAGIVAFGSALAFGAGLAFGVAPAAVALRASAVITASGSRATSPLASARTRSALLVGQVAFALALVVGAGLLVTSLRRALGTDPGFDPESLLTLRVAPPPESYDAPAQVVRFFERADRTLRALPGVRAVGAVSVLPASGPGSRGEVNIDGRQVAVETRPAASFLRVMPGYFSTLGVPLLRGRDFDARDDGHGEFVVIVSHALADRLWPGQSPLGRRIKVGPPEGEPWLRVVGVVADFRQAGLDAAPEYETFEPLAQRPRSVLRFAVRTAGSPSALAPAVLAAIRGLEPGVVLDEVATMDARIGAALRPRRLQALLLSAFAGLAGLIAALGVYGAASYAVAQRTREIGVRVALGATPERVLKLTMGHGLGPGAYGLGLGVVLSIGLAGSLRGLLYGVAPLEPATHLGALVLLGSAVAVASLVPALRALRVSPCEVLREE